MTSYTTAGLRNGQNYQLDYFADNGNVTTQYFETLQELAKAICGLKYDSERVNRWLMLNGLSRSDYWLTTRVRATSHRGRALDVLTLSETASKAFNTYGIWSVPGYVRRAGPVHGISKSRGGRHSRHCKSMGERRMNIGWLPEEGEVECRAVRRESYLYDTWDGRWRNNERCWKSQHRGLKSWDR